VTGGGQTGRRRCLNLAAIGSGSSVLGDPELWVASELAELGLGLPELGEGIEPEPSALDEYSESERSVSEYSDWRETTPVITRYP
jgi:hypothetical protein